MTGKIIKAACAALICTALVSCGNKVQSAGPMIRSPQAGSAADAVSSDNSEAAGADISPIGTTEPSRPMAPEKVEVDTDMPSGYKLPEKKVLEMEAVLQEPEIPTGCEVTALTETLNYYGFNVDKLYLCDEILPKDYNGYYYMDEAYVGDPHSDNGFGCFAPVIVRTANDYFDSIRSDWYAKDLTGCTMEDVFYQIDQGRPVIVWVTMSMLECYPEYKFTSGNGSDFVFNDLQHCIAIYGYDYKTRTVHTADPLKGNIEYDMDQFNKIFEIQGNQAVILLGNEESAGKVYATEEEIAEWLEINRPGDTQGLEFYIEQAKQEEENGSSEEDIYEEEYEEYYDEG